MNIETQFGMRIRYLRRQKHMSIEALALKADINKNYLSDLERGRRNPTLKIMEKIAFALSLDISELTKGLRSFSED